MTPTPIFNNIIGKLEENRRLAPKLRQVLGDLEEIAMDLELASNSQTTLDDTKGFFNILSELKSIDSNFLYNIFLTNLKIAIQTSDEYNYAPYISTLLRAATKDNFYRAIEFSFYMGGLVVTLDGNRLFDNKTPEGYAIAIRNVRRGISARKTDKTSMVGRSYRWREYIYKPGREGKVLPSKRKSGKPVAEGVRAREKQYRYADIIKKRLERGDAGFWYFLNFGTTSSKRFGEGGFAYPIQRPTNFLAKTSLMIKRIISTRFSDTYKEKINALNKNVSPTSTAEFEEYKKLLHKLRNQLYKISRSNLYEANKTLYSLDLLNKQTLQVFITRGGKINIRIRSKATNLFTRNIER